MKYIFFTAMALFSSLGFAEELKIDIPSEWMNLSKAVRRDVSDLSTEEIDFKWNSAKELYQLLNTFSGPMPLRSKWGTLTASYTSTNLSPSWPQAGLRIRGELSYTAYSPTANNIGNVHDLSFFAGSSFEPKTTRWRNGNLNFIIGGIWQQWFGPETKISLPQSGFGGGIQTTVEVKQNLLKLEDSQIKAVTSISRKDFFIATASRVHWVLQLGLGFTL
jgi:hypothetical protein